MATSDVEASEYNLRTTSVRLVRAGNVVQALFSNKLDARIFYAEVAGILKREEEKLDEG